MRHIFPYLVQANKQKVTEVGAERRTAHVTNVA